MTTFAFVALCLILFAIAGSFAVLWLMEKAQARVDASLQEIDAEIEKELERRANLEADLEQVKATLTILENRKPSDDKPLTATMPNQFQKMEQRYAQASKNTLVVNGVETPAG